MKTWIVLLRGINVGGKRVIRMAELRAMLEALGYENVKTYIQSGNIVLDSKASSPAQLTCAIAAAIKKSFGFDVPALALTREDMQSAISANPYLVPEDAQKTVHLFFLSQPAQNADHQRLETLRGDDEAYTLLGSALYLHAPNGIGRSKLAAGAEKALGVPVTARNLRSVNKIIALAI